jgi:phosphoglycerate kinase
VADDTRIVCTLDTLKELTDKGAKVIVLSHLGRPKGFTPALSNRRLLKTLQRHWDALRGTQENSQVIFIEDILSPTTMEVINKAPAGTLMLAENIRFYPEEEANAEEFSQKLAQLADFYVNDAFSVSHRSHSSTVGITQYLPAFAGRLLEKELQALQHCLGQPQRPVMAIVGGAKVSTKLKMLHHLLKKVDFLVVGGGMANTFLLAQGLAVGKSLCEKEKIPEAQELLQQAQNLNKKIILPQEVVVKDEEGNIRNKSVHEITAGESILDSGKEAVQVLDGLIRQCNTILWNGPVGLFEVPPFDQATVAIAHIIAEQTRQGKLLSVAGGGDTIAALNKAGVREDFSYVSTAGGAFLEWLEGITLPGIQALQ